MATEPRLYGGFTTLQGGVNGGLAPSLITANEVSAASNVTFRGGQLRTRPPWRNILLTFADANAEAHWAGVFQGACFYDASPNAESGWVASRGGFLFRISSTGIISDITPQVPMQVTAVFTVPGMGSQVTISVTDEAVLATGQVLHIDGGSYTVNVLLTNSVAVTYNGGAAHGTVAQGTPILDSANAQIIDFQTNPADFDFVFLFQAENYVIALAGQHLPMIYDGSSARRATKGEIPPGAFGCYGWGRIWVFLPNRRDFVAGNLVRDSQGGGTAQLNFVDSILKFTDNAFLNGGGTFGVPVNSGLGTGMQFLAAQDNSLGIGVLLVGAEGMVFSVNAPTDRTTWQNLTYPIQTVSLIDYGPTGPRCVPSVNGDLWFRSSDGYRSFRVASRFIESWGNTPQSFEISPVIDADTDDLLFYASAVLFDNKLLATVSPHRTASGVAHRGLVALNFDLISTLKTKVQPAWEGSLCGLDILQLVKGRIKSKERAWAFALNGNAVELWEFLPQKDTAIADQFYTGTANQQSVVRKSIGSWVETRSDPHGDSTQYKSLHMAELYVDQIADNVTIVVKFRPDHFPAWTTWGTITLCANVTDCNIKGPTGSTCFVFPINRKQYASRITLGQPPETCNAIANVPIRLGYEFQFRLEITGNCRVPMFKTHCTPKTQPMEGQCNPSIPCSAFQACEQGFFDYSIH